MAITQNHVINIQPGVSAPLVIHCSQGDTGTQINLTVVNGDEEFDCSSYACSVHGTRSDRGNWGPVTCNVSGSTVSFSLTSDMTAVAGSCLAEVSIGTVGTANFAILVENATFENGVTYSNDVSVYQNILTAVQTGITNETAERVEAVTNERNERVAADNSLSSRISQNDVRISNLVGNTGNSNSEIVDSRIAGKRFALKKYSTSGDAIRGQTEDLLKMFSEDYGLAGVSTFTSSASSHTSIIDQIVIDVTKGSFIYGSITLAKKCHAIVYAFYDKDNTDNSNALVSDDFDAGTYLFSAIALNNYYAFGLSLTKKDIDIDGDYTLSIVVTDKFNNLYTQLLINNALQNAYNLSSRFLETNFENYTNGYIVSDGSISNMSFENAEGYSDYIDNPKVPVLIDFYKSRASESWCRFTFYDENKNFVHSIDTTIENVKHYQKIVDLSVYDDPYIRISVRRQYYIAGIIVSVDRTTDAIQSNIDAIQTCVIPNAQTDLAFEYGDIGIGSSAPKYSDNVLTRVRTPENKWFHCDYGDEIIKPNKNIRMYIGWKAADGTYGTNGAWTFDTKYRCLVSGDYFIVLGYSNDKTKLLLSDAKVMVNSHIDAIQSNIDTIQSNIDTTQSHIDAIQSNIDAIQTSAGISILYEDISNMNKGYYNGYFVYIKPDSVKNEVYTPLIPIKNKLLRIFVEYSEPVIPWLRVTFFDSNGNPVENNDLVYPGTETTQVLYNSLDLSLYNIYPNYIVQFRSFGEKLKRFVIYYDENIDRLRLPSIRSFIKGVNHRGLNITAPENTIPAYELSAKNGFKYVETDIAFSKDGTPVLLHDNTINRTARNPDGSALSETINVNDKTLSELKEYDFGVYKSKVYAGTTIPTLEEFLICCRKYGLSPYIEIKSNGSYTTNELQLIVNTVKKCGMKEYSTYISFSYSFLEQIHAIDPTARLGYIVGNSITDSIIADTLKLISSNEVFIDAESDVDSNSIAKAINVGIPVEVWTVDSQSYIKSMSQYITGVTSNSLDASVIIPTLD